YFVLFVMDEHRLDRENTEVTLYGNISHVAEIFKLLRTYINKVSIIGEKPDWVSFIIKADLNLEAIFERQQGIIDRLLQFPSIAAIGQCPFNFIAGKNTFDQTFDRIDTIGTSAAILNQIQPHTGRQFAAMRIDVKNLFRD
ncbi:MAG: DUF3822 family protein, partial [Cyanobacteria bacterium RM1_2_2]|nr:DUF3822 family protein [Cyanobacteria bacterium RM1_2_2]